MDLLYMTVLRLYQLYLQHINSSQTRAGLWQNTPKHIRSTKKSIQVCCDWQNCIYTLFEHTPYIKNTLIFHFEGTLKCTRAAALFHVCWFPSVYLSFEPHIKYVEHCPALPPYRLGIVCYLVIRWFLFLLWTAIQLQSFLTTIKTTEFFQFRPKTLYCRHLLTRRKTTPYCELWL